MYKNKYYCKDCGKEVDRPTVKRCRFCYKKFINIFGNSSNFKNRKLEMECSYCHKTIFKNLSQIKLNNDKVFCDFKCMGLYRQNSYRGINNPAWIDGTSGIYPPEFNDSLKEQIRKRDNYTCQNCGMTEEEHLIVVGNNLEVHHIDYDKQNCKEDNLITACKQCNLRANANRDYWQEFYNQKLARKI